MRRQKLTRLSLMRGMMCIAVVAPLLSGPVAKADELKRDRPIGGMILDVQTGKPSRVASFSSIVLDAKTGEVVAVR